MRIDEYGIRRIQEQLETKRGGGDSNQYKVLSLKNKNTTLTLTPQPRRRNKKIKKQKGSMRETIPMEGTEN